MAETWRLFIATTLPPGVLAALAEIQRILRANTPHGVVRWVDPGGIHLTLKFLGDAPSLQRAELESALQTAASAGPPFELSLSDLGCFPSVRRPRVVWIGLSRELPALHTLRNEIERQIAPLGYPTEDRPFSPHLTLGRVRREASSTQASALGAQVIRARQYDRQTWRVTSVSLMRSELQPEGAVYSELYRALLRGTGAPPDTGEESC